VIATDDVGHCRIEAIDMLLSKKGTLFSLLASLGFIGCGGSVVAIGAGMEAIGAGGENDAGANGADADHLPPMTCAPDQTPVLLGVLPHPNMPALGPELVSIDPETGQYFPYPNPSTTNVLPVSNDSGLYGVAVDNHAHRLYIVGVPSGDPPPPPIVLGIDTSSGMVASRAILDPPEAGTNTPAPTAHPVAIAVNRDGVLLGIVSSGTGWEIRALDPLSGVSTPFPNGSMANVLPGFAFRAGSVFVGATNRWYWSSYSGRTQAIDMGTGALIEDHAIQPMGQFAVLGVTGDGALLGTYSSQPLRGTFPDTPFELRSVDPSTGISTGFPDSVQPNGLIGCCVPSVISAYDNNTARMYAIGLASDSMAALFVIDMLGKAPTRSFPAPFFQGLSVACR
jgi:hypothetical protein